MGILSSIGNWFRGNKAPLMQEESSGPSTGNDGSTKKEETRMSTSSSAKAYHNNLVGPVMRAGALADAVIEAARIDNPGKEVVVEDKRAYIRIHTEHEMILRQATIEEELGRPFKMNDLEVDLSSFAGQIESHDDSVRFYFDKRL